MVEDPPTPTTSPSTSSAAALCADLVAETPGERAIPGTDRSCTVDADCKSVSIDCSNLRCTAVHRDHFEAHSQPITCEGYDGMVGNYDCMPRFGSERPACVQGCCVSERLTGRATGDEACRAVADVYSRDSCSVFGPCFSITQCLTTVRDIRAEADDDMARQLQIGLDCARMVASCPDIQFCVSQFRGQ